ncbi:MAG: heparinase II/III family protein [Acetobacterales bacterium]
MSPDASVHRTRRPHRRPDLKTLWSRLLRIVWRSPFYQIRLNRSRVEQPLVGLRDPWPGSAERGTEILNGEFAFGGRKIAWGGGGVATDWMPGGAPEYWIAGLHRFNWLRDLRAVGTDAARRRARGWMSDWIDRNRRWHPVTWRPDTISSRIAAWLGHYDFFAASADEDFRQRMLASIEAQARHLARALPGDASGSALFSSLRGLIAAAASLPGCHGLLGRAIRQLEQEIEQQILPDGGHVERDPSRHLIVLRDLIDMRTALLAGNYPPPASLVSAIDKLGPMLRFYRHGDGGLALFNGSTEGSRMLIDLILTQSGAKGRAPVSAPYVGFQRMVSNRTLVLIDVGQPPAAGCDRRAHAGALSFEMSVGKQRLIVNCGAMLGESADWRRALGATAAHSTVTVGDRNLAEILEEGGIGRGPAKVACSRDEEGGNIWIDASHDGYDETLGIMHRRRIYLASGGAELRGEDVLVGAAGVPFVCRFHMHPTVQASMVEGGQAALLKLPNGEGWQFRVSGGRLALDESVYVGDGTTPKRTMQALVAGDTDGEETVVKWRFRKL